MSEDSLREHPLSELIDDRSDIADLRPQLKRLAQQHRAEGKETKIGDLLAMSTKNDAAYITDADLEKAEWVADLYAAEGEPEIHPRGFHYQLLGKGYTRRNGDEYANTNECWIELKEGFKWARILGLIDADRVQDEESAEPTYTAFPSRGSAAIGTTTTDAAVATAETVTNTLANAHLHDGFVQATIPSPDRFKRASLRYDDVDEFIDETVEQILDRAFTGIEFDAQANQDYYIEIWSEKSGVVEESLAKPYGATIRPHSRGEFSLSMVQEALDIAAERGQDLAVITVTDFDGKGHDMPVSASRKLEVEAALRDIEVELVHGAVTIEQVREYAIPGEPSKTPKGLEYGNTAAKGYETLTDMFREYAGQYPVEIRAFKSRYPAAFDTELERQLQQFYDADLADRLDEAIEEARAEAGRRLHAMFEDIRPELEAGFDALENAVDDYRDRVEADFDGTKRGVRRLADRDAEARDRAKVPKRRSELRTQLDTIDTDDLVDDLDVALPAATPDGTEAALLDTTRSVLDQLDFYKQYDMRESVDE